MRVIAWLIEFLGKTLVMVALMLANPYVAPAPRILTDEVDPELIPLDSKATLVSYELV